MNEADWNARIVALEAAIAHKKAAGLSFNREKNDLIVLRRRIGSEFWDAEKRVWKGQRPTERGARKSHEPDDPDKKPHLQFRYCPAKCFACAQCGYFWGAAREKEGLAGQPAFWSSTR